MMVGIKQDAALDLYLSLFGPIYRLGRSIWIFERMVRCLEKG